MNNNSITDKATNDIATILSQNVKLQKLCLAMHLQVESVIKIAEGLQKTTTLTV